MPGLGPEVLLQIEAWGFGEALQKGFRVESRLCGPIPSERPFEDCSRLVFP